MKKILIVSTLFISLITLSAKAQKYGSEPAEKFGNTLNIGAGIGYYGYIGHPLPVVFVNYEIDIARNVTLAPFIGFYTFTESHYWGNKDNPYRYYTYRETVVPMGVKGTYYFDELFHANPRWDFYAAASVGFALNSHEWENGYGGNLNAGADVRPLYSTAHIGSRLHFNSKAGIFLDLSTGVSTFGFSFKM